MSLLLKMHELLLCVLLLVSALAGTATASSPDLSSYPPETTEINLPFQGITHVPADTFVDFTALLFL
jgi:hypothetical protein